MKSSLTSFWYFYCWLWTYFTPFSSVSIVDFVSFSLTSKKLLQLRSVMDVRWKSILQLKYSWQGDFGRFIIANLLTPLIAESILSPSQNVTGNVQPIRNKTNKSGKRLDLSQSFLSFAQVLKRLIRLKRLVWHYVSKYYLLLFMLYLCFWNLLIFKIQ